MQPAGAGLYPSVRQFHTVPHDGLPSRLDRALSDLPRRYPGPGGGVAVLRDGEVLERRAWGFADAERRIPFPPRTLFRICSITKQFTCALLLDPHPDPSKRDADMLARLPGLDGAAPGALHLAYDQSGLRDDWALAMLHGASAESAFRRGAAQRRGKVQPPVRRPDVLALPCPRALDHSPPGGWPLRFSRDGAGRVEGVTVRCWLARGLRYERVR